MTESLLQKLEEKMMLLLTEVEDLRAEVKRVHQDNATLAAERESHARKLHDLIALLDSVAVTEGAQPVAAPISTLKPVYMQEKAVVEQSI